MRIPDWKSKSLVSIFAVEPSYYCVTEVIPSAGISVGVALGEG